MLVEVTIIYLYMLSLPLGKMMDFVSWDDDIHSQYDGKLIKFHGSKPPTKMGITSRSRSIDGIFLGDFPAYTAGKVPCSSMAGIAMFEYYRVSIDLYLGFLGCSSMECHCWNHVFRLGSCCHVPVMVFDPYSDLPIYRHLMPTWFHDVPWLAMK